MTTDDMMPRSEALREALEKARKGVTPAALLLSLAETRRRLGIGRTTLYRQMKEGKLVYVKIGRRRLISVKAIEQFIEQSENGEAEG
jgi:excisionase family DNA binding protein